MKVCASDEQLEQIACAYDGELPSYLMIHSIDRISIRAAAYEGAPVREVAITPSSLVAYYRADNPLGCAGLSGCRELAGFTADWRTVDAMAREALTIFKILNRRALEQEAARYGLRLRP